VGRVCKGRRLRRWHVNLIMVLLFAALVGLYTRITYFQHLLDQSTGKDEYGHYFGAPIAALFDAIDWSVPIVLTGVLVLMHRGNNSAEKAKADKRP